MALLADFGPAVLAEIRAAGEIVYRAISDQPLEFESPVPIVAQ